MGKIVKGFEAFDKPIKNPDVGLFNEAISDNKRLKIREAKNIKITNILPSKFNPYEVNDDDELLELAESIKENGILTPLLVREIREGKYEIISGHRRYLASTKYVGLSVLPCEIIDITDDDAYILMVDSNQYRKNLKISEEAKAYRLKFDSLKRQGKRSDLTSSQIETKLDKPERTTKIIAESSPHSRAKVDRLIKISYLIKPLLSMVDEKKINLENAYYIAFLDEDKQDKIFTLYIGEPHLIPKKFTKEIKDDLLSLKNSDIDTVRNYFMSKLEFESSSKTKNRKCSINISKMPAKIEQELSGLTEKEIKELIEDLLNNYVKKIQEERDFQAHLAKIKGNPLSIDNEN